MIAVSKYLRALYAYTLLCVMAMQWLAGSLYLKTTYLVEFQTEMNSTEQAIADVVMERFGFMAHVELLDVSDIQFIHGLGYAAPFVHALEVDGSESTFTLTGSESKYQQVELEITNRDDRQHEQKNRVCLEKLFSQFCFGEYESSENDRPVVIAEANFSLTPLHSIFDRANPSPPPEPI